MNDPLLTDPTHGLWGYSTLKKMYPTLKPDIDKLYANEDMQMTQPAVTKFIRRKTVARTLDLNHQIDLLDISKFAADNNNYHFLLTSIDVLSRYAQAIPLLNKSAKEVARGLETLFEERKPSRISFDRGKEFLNKTVSALLHDWHIFPLALNPPMKASMVERFHRTLWQLINRYQLTHDTDRFIDVLPQLLDNYNSKVHSVIKMAPQDVTEENAEEAYQNSLNNTKNSAHIPRSEMQGVITKYHVGDYVRVQTSRSAFAKESVSKWSREVFIVSRVLPTWPTTYTIEDRLGEAILGSFYDKDLQATTLPESFKVEKILATKYLGTGRNRKKMVLVKWQGYQDKFDSWVNAEDVV